MMFHALRECHQEAKSALIIHNHVRNHSVYCAFKFRILLMDHCTIKVLHLWKNAHAFRIRWQHCTPSLHNTARTGSTARAWGSKYPAGLNLIHWGKLAWSCHHAQRSLKCMFVKNAGFGTRELRCYLPRHCEVTLLTKGRSGWPRAPGWRDDRRCRRRVFSEHVQISTGLCVFHISRLSSSLAAF